MRKSRKKGHRGGDRTVHVREVRSRGLNTFEEGRNGTSSQVVLKLLTAIGDVLSYSPCLKNILDDCSTISHTFSFLISFPKAISYGPVGNTVK